MPINILYILYAVFIPVLSLAQPVTKQASSFQAEIQKYEKQATDLLDLLNECKDTCITECKTTKCYVYNLQCLETQCTATNCEQTDCSTQKSNYDNMRSNIDDYKQKIQNYTSVKLSKNRPQSAQKQVKKGQMMTNIMAGIGAVTTAFLGYKAYGFCAAQEYADCALFGAMTAAGAMQTGTMLMKKDELGKVKKGLCNAGGCGADIKPYFPKGSPKQARVISKILSPNNPDSLSSSLDEKLISALAAVGLTKKNLPKKFFKNGNTVNRKWIDDQLSNLSPEQKKQVQAIRNKIKKRQDASLKQALIEQGLDDFEDEQGLGIEAGENNLANKDKNVGTSSFSGAKQTNSSYAGDSSKQRSKKNKSALSKQLDQMMKQLYGKNNKSKKQDFLNNKSISFGSDLIGVKEDNIFMMAHRRYRKLEKRHIFIKISAGLITQIL